LPPLQRPSSHFPSSARHPSHCVGDEGKKSNVSLANRSSWHRYTTGRQPRAYVEQPPTQAAQHDPPDAASLGPDLRAQLCGQDAGHLLFVLLIGISIEREREAREEEGGLFSNFPERLVASKKHRCVRVAASVPCTQRNAPRTRHEWRWQEAPVGHPRRRSPRRRLARGGGHEGALSRREKIIVFFLGWGCRRLGRARARLQRVRQRRPRGRQARRRRRGGRRRRE
jgi:hypothetical protein